MIRLDTNVLTGQSKNIKPQEKNLKEAQTAFATFADDVFLKASRPDCRSEAEAAENFCHQTQESDCFCRFFSLRFWTLVLDSGSGL